MILLHVFQFGWLVAIPLGIASSALEEKTCAATTWIKKHKSMLRKNFKKAQ